VVGYPTSFMSLRFWLSDEIANVAVNMRKLIGTKHPLVEAAKGFLFDGKDTMQTRGLVVLLVSKAAGLGQGFAVDGSGGGDDAADSVQAKQRSLAEITEMMHTATAIHRGVADTSAQPAELAADMMYGNKLAILSGDYLLARASAGLAHLNNTHVVEVMANALAHIAESEFSEAKDPEQATLESWEKMTYLTSGSLLSKSLVGALLLAGHSRTFAESASLFGVHLSLARQLADDVLKCGDQNAPSGSLLLPHILCRRLRASAAEPSDALAVRAGVLCDRVIWGELRALSWRYSEAALESLSCFEPSDARTALENLTRAVICVER